MLLTIRPVDRDELSLHENYYLLSPRSVHLYSSVLEKAIIRNINRTGVILYPFLTPALKLMYVSILLMMRLTFILLYICLIDEHSLEGAPYFPSMEIISA